MMKGFARTPFLACAERSRRAIDLEVTTHSPLLDEIFFAKKQRPRSSATMAHRFCGVFEATEEANSKKNQYSGAYQRAESVPFSSGTFPFQAPALHDRN